MMDLVDEVESYSPQTGQPNNANPNVNPYFQSNPYQAEPNPYDFNPQQPSEDSSTEAAKSQKDKEEKEKETGCTRFCRKKYYEQFFKVSESQVMERAKAAVVPPFNEDFVDLIRPTPDFYGPFWTMMTVVFLLSMVGNFANYIESKFSNDAKWEGYFFRLELVRYGTIVVFTFGAGVPLVLFAMFKVLKCNDMTLPEVICLYGYSLFCYVPALLLCIIPFGVVQWLALIYALCNSCLFLWLSLKKHIDGAKRILVFSILAAMQITLFLLARLLFFGAPKSAAPAPLAPETPVQPDVPVNTP